MFDECINNSLGIFASDLYQHHVKRLAFNERGNLATSIPKQQTTFPVTWYRTILYLNWPLSLMDTAFVILP